MLGPASTTSGSHGSTFFEACEASLRRLQTDYVDLYMAHDPDALVPMEETLRAFDDLVLRAKCATSAVRIFRRGT